MPLVEAILAVAVVMVSLAVYLLARDLDELEKKQKGSFDYHNARINALNERLNAGQIAPRTYPYDGGSFIPVATPQKKSGAKTPKRLRIAR